MPTQHVEPESHDHLQDVAGALLKARKIVVVTGAGISTNSGIPDFRSENGLYSLIQAQFEAASQQTRQSERTKMDNATDEGEGDRPRKRRRISRDNSPDSGDVSQEIKGEVKVRIGAVCVEPDLPPIACDGTDTSQSKPNALDEPCVSTPRPKLPPSSTAHLTTSPLSSPPAEEFIIPPSSLRPGPHRRMAHLSSARASSPLSSPPSGLFDASPPASPSDASISRRSSTTPSEVEESQTSTAFTASQTSTSGKINLPNMKGKDLFDASIWSDPTRTTVFYRFATSLRQKVRDAEPTSSHKFISHLRDRGKLVRCYTQNIDQIEEKVGLSTSLLDGPGSRGRFSRRSTANMSQLKKMVEEVTSGNSSDAASSDKPSQSGNESSQQNQADASDNSSPPSQVDRKTDEPEFSQPDQTKVIPPKREPPKSGVECVFLHGSLELLRCFLCGQVCSWDDDDRVMETLSGQQPECPHCVGATEARREKGKRALGVGKLRPDIVLYGEEHPNAHLISPIVTHDLALYPDMLLILGTSLRVHGLKVMVREFAKTVHSKGGKVVFVNFTKPPESSWGDIIDYWVQWDCDAWVSDLQVRIPKLWQAPEPPKPKKKRDSGGVASEDNKEEKKKPPAANPAALRDTQVSGAYCTLKILRELHRITRKPLPQRRASIAVVNPTAMVAEPTIQVTTNPLPNTPKTKPKRPRKSAPGALEKPKRTSSTLNPNHGRNRKQAADITPDIQPSQPLEPAIEFSSILDSVKNNPRVRKRKMIDGIEVYPIGQKHGGSQIPMNKADLTLPPLRPEPNPVREKPQPLEPTSPPTGPPSLLSPNRQAARTFNWPHSFYLQDPCVNWFGNPPYLVNLGEQGHSEQHRWPTAQHGTKEMEEVSVAATLASMRTDTPVVSKLASPILPRGLMNWASAWECRR